MKRPILALMLVLIASAPGPPELPPLNAKVAAFARDHLGKSVGDGLCITLATEALHASGATEFPLDDPEGEYVWGREVESPADALPGDVLQFQDAVFEWKETVGRRRTYYNLEYKHHTAIVAKIAERGKVVTIYHQNVTTRGEDASTKENVQESTLRLDALRPGGTVRVFRPVERGKRPGGASQAGPSSRP